MADPVEDAVGRLYGLPLEDFTRERDAIARELRRAKDREAADTVSKLPKPTQAAWAANHLARERRDLVDDLLAAGDSLREAQDSAMSGKGAALLREAGAAERAAVEALVDAAKDLRPAGRRPSEATLERLRTTLHAAAGNEEVREALAAGRLVEDAEATSAWGLLDMAAVAADDETSAAPPRRRPPRARAATKRRGKERTPEEREAAAREAEERAAAEQAERERRQQLEAELREARAERRAHERELGRAEREAERAAARLESALQAAEQARAQVDEANDELEAAREAAEEARDRVARLEEQLD